MKKITQTQSTLPAATSRPASHRVPLSDARRRDELARLLPVWPSEAADLSLAGRRHIIRIVERALRAERRRGRAGHWAYNLSRHAALLATWKSECAALVEFETALQELPTKSPRKGGRF